MEEDKRLTLITQRQVYLACLPVRNGHFWRPQWVLLFAPDADLVSAGRDSRDGEPAFLIGHCGELVLRNDNPPRHFRMNMAEQVHHSGLVKDNLPGVARIIGVEAEFFCIAD